MTEIDYANARPLDVHRWSEYPEVNDLVGHVFTDLQSINGNSRISKKLVKVILLDLYVAWCADPVLMLMFSRDNNAYKARSRYNELHISKKIISIVDSLIANGVIGQQLGFNDRESGIGFQSRLWASEKLITLTRAFRDAYALSEMIQWIWRTQIRNGEPVCVYMPSKKMRVIIERWLGVD